MDERQDLASIFPTGSATHKGCVRDENQDSVLARPEIGLWAVADGMGGHEDGAYASQAVIAALSAIHPDEAGPALVDACIARIAHANSDIRAFSKKRGAIVGTTVALVLVTEMQAISLWCGDSRVYRIRRGAISLLTRDHTEVQDLLDRGVLPEAGRPWPQRNVLTRAVGVFETAPLDIRREPLEENDTFVLCSDGLTAHVGDDEILSLAGRSAAQSGCSALLDLALSRGGTDNVSVVVAQYRPNATRRMPSQALAG